MATGERSTAASSSECGETDIPRRVPARRDHPNRKSLLSGRNLPFEAVARGVERIAGPGARHDLLRRVRARTALAAPRPRHAHAHVHPPASTHSGRAVTGLGLTTWQPRPQP